MKCDTVVDLIPLYYYGELTPAQEEEVEAHVFECSACKKELDLHEQITQTLDNYRVEPVSLSALECRRQLMDTIRREESSEPKQSWWTLLWQPIRVTLRPVGALALLALGFFAGQRQFFDMTPGNNSAAMAEPVFSAVRSVQADASGGIQIALDETRRRTVKGSLDDDRIARLLLAAARDEANPGLRVESIEILKNYSESDQVRAALIQALTHDANPGVRLKALEGLKQMASHPEVRKTLAQVLQKDDNAGVRIQAIDLLVQQRDDAIVGILQRLVGREDNNYVRMRCKNALEEMNASVGTF